MLGRPHLMLAHFGRDKGILTGFQRLFIQTADCLLRFGNGFTVFEGQAFQGPPFIDLAPPALHCRSIWLLLACLHNLDQVFQRVSSIPDDGQVDAHILVDGRCIDIDMDLLGIGGERIQPPGDAIIKARSNGQHDIAIMHRPIRLIGSMHTQHAQILRLVGWERPQAHQGQGAGKIVHAHKFSQQFCGIRPGIDDPTARIHNRALGRQQQINSRFDAGMIGLQDRFIGLVRRGFRHFIGAGRKLHILWQVNHDRAGTPAGRDIKGLVHRAGQLVHILDQIIVLCAGARDPGRVAFLECIIPNQMGRHLPGQADDGNGIHQRIGQAGHRIGRARARGHQHNTRLAGGPRIAFRRMHSTLFMTHQNVAHMVLFEQRIINWQHGAAWISKYNIDTLIF